MHQNRTVNAICEQCGSPFYAPPKHRRQTCSRACQRAATAARVPDRFWTKVDRSGGPDACWPWIGRNSVNGYGRLTIQTEGGHRSERAHRLALKLSGVDVPDDMHVCHRCDNPPCCNPTHLFVGTDEDNVRDRDAKGRACNLRGGAHPRSKMTEDDVRKIRHLYSTKQNSATQLAERYGVHTGTIWAIARRKTWKHVA